MIVISLAGNSSRFFNSGYDLVKYKLPINNKTVIEYILSYVPKSEKLLLILNSKFSDSDYFNKVLSELEFLYFKIVEISETKGQLDSVVKGLMLSLDFYNITESITIYNGDTIRKIHNWTNFPGDGYIETFISSGNHWSFVDKIGSVNIVKEKEKISDYCSSGLYYFKSARIIFDNIDKYLCENLSTELYIAPFYNTLISQKFDIRSGLVSKKSFIFCGTPVEYENSILP
jgi:dTDP-glucose pyrophosphorylase